MPSAGETRCPTLTTEEDPPKDRWRIARPTPSPSHGKTATGSDPRARSVEPVFGGFPGDAGRQHVPLRAAVRAARPGDPRAQPRGAVAPRRRDHVARAGAARSSTHREGSVSMSSPTRTGGAGTTAPVECRSHGRDFMTAETALLRSLIAGPPAMNRRPAPTRPNGYPGAPASGAGGPAVTTAPGRARRSRVGGIVGVPGASLT